MLLDIVSDRPDVRKKPRWLGQSAFASVTRPVARPMFSRQFNDARDWLSIAIDRDGAIGHSHSGRNRGCGGGLVRSGEIFRVIGQ